MTEPNPFALPEHAAAPTGDEAARLALLPTEGRLRAIGLLWQAGAGAQAALFLFAAVSAVPPALRGRPSALTDLALCLGMFALQSAFWYQGVRLRNLMPGSPAVLAALALIGACVGPCSAVGWFFPFILLSASARGVLTEEHAALRLRTPHLQPNVGSAVGLLLAAAATTAVMVAIVLVAGLTVLGNQLERNFDDVSRAIDAPGAPHR